MDAHPRREGGGDDEREVLQFTEPGFHGAQTIRDLSRRQKIPRSTAFLRGLPNRASATTLRSAQEVGNQTGPLSNSTAERIRRPRR